MKFKTVTGIVLASAEFAQGGCVEKSSDPVCTSFVWSEAEAAQDNVLLCKQMPYMPGCTLRNLCKQAGSSSGHCTEFNFAYAICKKDPSMDTMIGCERMNGICAEGSVVPACRTALQNPIGTFDIQEDISAQCKTLSLPACSKCPSARNCKDPMLYVMENCKAGASVGCNRIKEFCSSLSAEYQKVFCSLMASPVTPAPTSPPTSGPAPTTAPGPVSTSPSIKTTTPSTTSGTSTTTPSKTTPSDSSKSSSGSSSGKRTKSPITPRNSTGSGVTKSPTVGSSSGSIGSTTTSPKVDPTNDTSDSPSKAVTPAPKKSTKPTGTSMAFSSQVSALLASAAFVIAYFNA